MNNYKQGRAAKGKELFITNYNIRKENDNGIDSVDSELTLDVCV